VLANWNEEAGLVTGPYTLPPLGFIGKHKDDRLVFGLFTDYNNFPLTGGDHFLIEERTSDTIIIRQPLGESTGLTVTLPQGWTKTDMITIQAHTKKGQIIDPIPLAVTDNWIRFIYKMERAGQPISYYEIRRHN
jgi:hypothetical protein